MIALAAALALAAPVPAAQRAPAVEYQRLAGRSFTVVHSVRRKRTRPSDDGNLPPELRLDRTLVQIARPANASERAWNRAMHAWLREGEALAFPGEKADSFGKWEGPGQADVTIELVAASPELIITRLGVSTYFGGAHPNYVSRVTLWSVPRARALRNAELFANIADLRLRALVQRHFSQQGCELPHLEAAKVLPMPKEIVFEFDPYEIGPYTCGGISRLRWSEAGPFLREPLPFDRARLVLPARKYRLVALHGPSRAARDPGFELLDQFGIGRGLGLVHPLDAGIGYDRPVRQPPPALVPRPGEIINAEAKTALGIMFGPELHVDEEAPANMGRVEDAGAAEVAVLDAFVPMQRVPGDRPARRDSQRLQLPIVDRLVRIAENAGGLLECARPVHGSDQSMQIVPALRPFSTSVWQPKPLSVASQMPWSRVPACKVRGGWAGSSKHRPWQSFLPRQALPASA